LASCPLLCQTQPKAPQLDALLVEVLTRVVNTAGGSQALASVHDLTESGEITFHWGDGHSGPVTIKALGTNHFRMEADLPEGKRTWVVKGGVGSLKEANGKNRALPYDNAINLENLTFPLAYFAAALANSKTEISLVGIEEVSGRSIYRLRAKGQLGLGGELRNPAVVKDLLVDALTFKILKVEDRPFQMHEATGKKPNKPTREIDFEDFRTVNGVLVPFSITTKLMGQKTMTIKLSGVVFNGNLGEQDFKD
jgi:hypothetical protein